MRNKLQHIAVEQSRLGIPLIFGHDAIHGFRTVFPIPLAQACAWDPGLFERTTTIGAREAAAAGIDWTFSPKVHLARDPRWRRIAEGLREDPYLGSLDAAASVRGFQARADFGRHQPRRRLRQTLRRLRRGGGRPRLQHDGNFRVHLRNFYLPQSKAGCGALTAMSAFNDLDGHSRQRQSLHLTSVLRDEWKFKGFVVSDYDSVSQMIAYGYAANNAGAARSPSPSA